jgi:DNA-binding NarL/FixJ family response regulator
MPRARHRSLPPTASPVSGIAQATARFERALEVVVRAAVATAHNAAVARAGQVLVVGRLGHPRRVLRAASWLEPDVAGQVVGRIARDFNVAPRAAEVLLHALAGVPRRFIAGQMGLSPDTVKTLVRILCRRVGQPTLDDAVWWTRTKIAAAQKAKR